MSTDQNEWIPSTDLVRDRYYSATVSDDTPEWWMDRNRHSSDAEFNRWLEDLKDQLREEIRAEEKPSNKLPLLPLSELIQNAEDLAARLAENWKQAERPFSDSDFDSDDSLAVLHAVGYMAVREMRNLAKALREAQERPATAWPGGGAAKSASVADIYATSPYASLLIEALDHKPGDFTSDDFKRGYFAAVAVSHIRGAAALDSFGTVDERELIAAAAGDRGISSVQADALADELVALGFSRTPQSTDWEYGWRAFFSNGEEVEWIATHSREDAEQQIKDFQEEEDRTYGDGNAEGKLTYSLWRRRKAAAGAWERVEENSDGEN